MNQALLFYGLRLISAIILLAFLAAVAWLVYQDLKDLINSVRYDNAEIDEFDTSCFSGFYVTGDVSPEYLKVLETQRSDGAKSHREAVRRQLEGDSEDETDVDTGTHAGVA